MVTWAHERGVQLSDPAGQAQPERLCRIVQRPAPRWMPHEHWFTHLLHARSAIETWRREYNEERPKNALGGLTPSAYAKHLANFSYSDPGL